MDKDFHTFLKKHQCNQSFQRSFEISFPKGVKFFDDGIYTISLKRILCILASKVKFFPEFQKFHFDLESEIFRFKFRISF